MEKEERKTSKKTVKREAKTVKTTKDNKKPLKRKESNEIRTNLDFSLPEVIVLLLIACLVVSVASGIVVYKNYGKLAGITDTNQTITSKDLDEFVQNYNIILNGYVEKVDKKELLDAAISGMYNFLGDDYSMYLSKEDSQSFEERLAGEYDGIGVEIVTLTDGETYITVVSNVFKDTPAEKAGIKTGDIITKVDGKEVLKSSELANYIKNNEKKEFEVTIKRDDKEETLKIVKEHVLINSVTSKTEGNVGYIKIDTFSDKSESLVKEALDSFGDEITSLVVDVRDNSGGYLTSATDISELFVDEGSIIYQIEDRNGEISSYKATKPSYKKFNKIVVLVNESSASASELLTLVLKDNLGAKVVGTKTFGKGSVQATNILESGAMVKYTTAHWMGPAGVCIDKEGIEPDVEVKEADKQYNRAIEEAK